MPGPFTSPTAYSVPFDNTNPLASGFTSEDTFSAIIEAKQGALNNDRYPVDCFYNGNAGATRFLEFFTNIDSSQINAPFIPPENSKIITIVAGAVANSTGVVSIYKNGNYATSIYDITYTNNRKIILTGLTIALTALDDISIRVSSGSINKPYIRFWINTAS